MNESNKDHWYATTAGNHYPTKVDSEINSSTRYITTQAAGGTPYANETMASQYTSRPTNTSVLFCIKY